jgi:hypothetical protein
MVRRKMREIRKGVKRKTNTKNKRCSTSSRTLSTLKSSLLRSSPVR